ncbi:DNA-binding protein [Escherichia coli]|uniref:Arc family DNA-binding protein n=1 Tax=Escherichia coli TaxID=562 RepID=UPI0007752AA6|nr:Arc family DNA-binding protein [Escherichia coli]KXP45893.1 DNA-binding protein [Escherichia coli]HBB3501413.1 Arc family DNA-binding protein [Escherichia coli]
MSERRYKNPQVNLRLPVEIKDRLTALAEANGRSLNAEMVAALSAWAEENKHVHSLSLSSLTERLIALEREVAALKEANIK